MSVYFLQRVSSVPASNFQLHKQSYQSVLNSTESSTVALWTYSWTPRTSKLLALSSISDEELTAKSVSFVVGYLSMIAKIQRSDCTRATSIWGLSPTSVTSMHLEWEWTPPPRAKHIALTWPLLSQLALVIWRVLWLGTCIGFDLFLSWTVFEFLSPLNFVFISFCVCGRTKHVSLQNLRISSWEQVRFSQTQICKILGSFGDFSFSRECSFLVAPYQSYTWVLDQLFGMVLFVILRFLFRLSTMSARTWFKISSRSVVPKKCTYSYLDHLCTFDCCGCFHVGSECSRWRDLSFQSCENDASGDHTS